jgi:mercuric ion transport protein
VSLDNCTSSTPGADHRSLAWVLAGGGVAASLALIACCALPPLLAGVGLAGAWTLEVQTVLGPHEQLLLWLALVGLGSGATAWAWQLRRSCAGCGERGRRSSLVITPLMLVLGAILTWIALHPI